MRIFIVILTFLTDFGMVKVSDTTGLSTGKVGLALGTLTFKDGGGMRSLTGTNGESIGE